MFEKILLKNAEKPDAHGIEAYEAAGGYQALAKVLREFSPDGLIQLVKDSNLKGRGGAGFPTGVKWGFVPKDSDKPKYLCCNADESEPGTFKDRVIMEGDPHMTLEGMALASYAIGAEVAYLYIRGEFVLCIERLETALDEAYRKDVESDIGDVRNLAKNGRWGGACTAAAFLEAFIDEKRTWAHMDIAGTAYLKSDNDLGPKGATGVGVRILEEFVKNYK